MFDLPETVTVWNKTGGSGYAGFTWSEPMQIKGRFAFRVKKVINEKGAEIMSACAVYFDDERVALDSKILLSASTELSPPAEAKDVITFAATPSGTTMRVAYL